MGKFKKGLVEDIKQEQAFQRQQTNLKEKYNITEQEVVVVEKSNMVKFTAKAVAAVIRTVATICILFLAAVGLLALVYPNIRAQVAVTWNEIFRQIQQYLPF